jgi:hypothetical protein
MQAAFAWSEVRVSDMCSLKLVVWKPEGDETIWSLGRGQARALPIWRGTDSNYPDHPYQIRNVLKKGLTD